MLRKLRTACPLQDKETHEQDLQDKETHEQDLQDLHDLQDFTEGGAGLGFWYPGISGCLILQVVDL